MQYYLLMEKSCFVSQPDYQMLQQKHDLMIVIAIYLGPILIINFLFESTADGYFCNVSAIFL